MHETDTYELTEAAMRLRVDEDADALHLQLVDVPVEESEEVAPGVIVDYDKSKSSNRHRSAVSFKETPPGKFYVFSIRDSTQKGSFGEAT